MRLDIQGTWRSIRSKFHRPDQQLEAEARLTRAYQQVFAGSPSREDQETVLADLAYQSGFYRITDAKLSTDRELWQMEGRRALYGVIFSHLTLREADVRELEYAARKEAAFHQTLEGTNLT